LGLYAHATAQRHLNGPGRVARGQARHGHLRGGSDTTGNRRVQPLAAAGRVGVGEHLDRLGFTRGGPPVQDLDLLRLRAKGGCGECEGGHALKGWLAVHVSFLW